MSEAVTELGGKVAEAHVTVRDAGLRGMITLRGDLSDPDLRRVCETVTGVSFPNDRHAVGAGQSGLAWMSPDEMLVLVPYAEALAQVAVICKALAGKHFVAKNVSDARTVMFVEGRGAREVLAKLAPVDLHPDSFRPGEMRRTRLGQVAAAFWMRDADTFEVICFRSVGDYCFSLLAASAEDGPVGVF
jgi:sarcosine oxidase subunit gamma